MRQIVLSSDAKYEYTLLQSDDEEIITLRNLIITYGSSKDELFRNTHKLNNIIAFGRAYDITEHQARKYIPAGKHSEGRGETLYRCCVPYDKDKCYLSHYDATSAWYCALEALDRPMYAILVRVPRNVPKTYGDDTNRDTEVHSGSETV